MYTVDRTAAPTGEGQGKNVRLYNVQKQEVLADLSDRYAVGPDRGDGEPFVGDHLSFTIEFPEDRTYDDGTGSLLQLNSLEDLVTDYRNRTGAASQLSEESNIVNFAIQGEVVTKESTFLNKLMETYIESELNKQQKKG